MEKSVKNRENFEKSAKNRKKLKYRKKKKNRKIIDFFCKNSKKIGKNWKIDEELKNREKNQKIAKDRKKIINSHTFFGVIYPSYSDMQRFPKIHFKHTITGRVRVKCRTFLN